MPRLTKNEISLIGRIGDRAVREFPDRYYRDDVVIVVADVHLYRGLKLQDLLEGSLMDFAHDVSGCINNWDYSTKTFRDLFDPRYSKE